jgi:hypothetical protein
MAREFWFGQMLTVSATLLVLGASQPVQAQSMRTVNGQSYWEMDPGPVAVDPHFAGNADKYDPHDYLDRINRDPQLFDQTLYAEHQGSERCVWRKRVVNSTYEYEHPYVRVCRP